MPRTNKPRAGSLQFWPRKRAERFLPSVNWRILEERNKFSGPLGFIGYKVGMATILVKDKTPDSLTKDKKIPVPATIIELPIMKIFSIRFYKDNKVIDEILAENLDKELKKKVKLPKGKERRKIEDIKGYDNIRVVVYSVVKETEIKKTPDIIEVGLAGKLEDKIKFVKEKIGKEISASEIFKPLQLVDFRGLTKGKGFVGPIKRFGISKRHHKSEKGVRRPGSLGPWHPNVVTFRVAMAGQLGMFTRIHYNGKILSLGKIKENNINKKSGWKNYGNIKTEYAIISGSVPGPAKRQLLLTFPLRKTKNQEKKNFEFIKIM
ncbi:MAG: 50S ribosomal protein L3 [Candidatus Pacearchaeota archaeon]